MKKGNGDLCAICRPVANVIPEASTKYIGGTKN